MPAGKLLESPKSPGSGKQMGETLSVNSASPFNFKRATSKDFLGSSEIRIKKLGRYATINFIKIVVELTEWDSL